MLSAEVMKSVNMRDSKSRGASLVGSSPTLGIFTRNEELFKLKNLVAAPEVKDLITKVTIGRIGNQAWGYLYLTEKGLIEHTGYEDRCMMPSDCQGMHHSYENEPEAVKPSMQLVEKYRLVESKLKKTPCQDQGTKLISPSVRHPYKLPFVRVVLYVSLQRSEAKLFFC